MRDIVHGTKLKQLHHLIRVIPHGYQQPSIGGIAPGKNLRTHGSVQRIIDTHFQVLLAAQLGCAVCAV